MPAYRHEASSTSALSVSKAALLPADEEVCHARWIERLLRSTGRSTGLRLRDRVRRGRSGSHSRSAATATPSRGDPHERTFVEADGTGRDEKGSAPPRGPRPRGTGRPMDRQCPTPSSPRSGRSIRRTSTVTAGAPGGTNEWGPTQSRSAPGMTRTSRNETRPHRPVAHITCL